MPVSGSEKLSSRFLLSLPVPNSHSLMIAMYTYVPWSVYKAVETDRIYYHWNVYGMLNEGVDTEVPNVGVTLKFPGSVFRTYIPG